MKKFLIGVPMYFFGAYALLGYVTLMLLLIGVLIELLIGPIGKSSVLKNIIDFFNILFDSGFVGLIAAIWTPGQFYISYLICNFLKKYYY